MTLHYIIYWIVELYNEREERREKTVTVVKTKEECMRVKKTIICTHVCKRNVKYGSHPKPQGKDYNIIIRIIYLTCSMDSLASRNRFQVSVSIRLHLSNFDPPCFTSFFHRRSLFISFKRLQPLLCKVFKLHLGWASARATVLALYDKGMYSIVYSNSSGT